jgi:hypothetical protein
MLANAVGHAGKGYQQNEAALAQLRAVAHTAQGNYTGAIAKNLGMWS